MVNNCVVPECKFQHRSRLRSPKTANVSLHRIPANDSLRKAWIKAIGKKSFSKYACICSQHFKPEDMDYTGQVRRLREGAVPSIFPWTPKSLRHKSNASARLTANQSSNLTSNPPINMMFNPSTNLTVNPSTSLTVNPSRNLTVNPSTNLTINPPTNLNANPSSNLTINSSTNMAYIPVLLIPETSAITVGSNFILSQPACTENVISQPVYSENMAIHPVYSKNVATQPVCSENVASKPILIENVVSMSKNNKNITVAKPKDTEDIQIQPLSCVNTDDAIYIFSGFDNATEPAKPVSHANVNLNLPQLLQNTPVLNSCVNAKGIKTLPYSKVMKEKIRRLSCRLRFLKKKLKGVQLTAIKRSREAKINQKIVDYFEGNPRVLNIVHVLNMLERNLPPGVNSLVKRTVSIENSEHNGDIDINLQVFAAKLYGFSEKAYSFVRSTFNDALPSPQVIKDICVEQPKNNLRESNINGSQDIINEAEGQATKLNLGETTCVDSKFFHHDMFPVLRDVFSHIDTEDVIECDDNDDDDNDDNENEDDITPFPKRLSDLNSKLCSTKREIKVVQQRIRRNERKLLSDKNFMCSLVAAIPTLNDISDILEKTLPHDICSLVKRAIGVERNEDSGFEPDLISFALTLHHLSPEAYVYVRSNFNNALPSLNTIQSWYNESEPSPEEQYETIEP